MRLLKRIWNRLDLRLTVLVLLLSVVPLLILGLFALNRSQKSLETQQFRHLNAVALLKADEMNRWTEHSLNSLNALAQRPLVREFAEALTAADSPAVRDSLLANHLLPALSDTGGFWELFLLDTGSGEILISTDESNEGKFRSSEPYFYAGQEASYIQNVYYSLSLGQPAMTLSTPVRNEEGELVAVLAGHLDLKELSAIAEQTNELTNSEDTFLVNRFNFYVTNPRFGQEFALQEATYTEGVTRCLKGQTGHGIYEDYRGVVVLGAYRWLPERELCVLTEIDQSEALEAIQNLRRSLLTMSALVTAGILTSGIFFTHSITAPLRRLMQGARRVGQGDLNHQVPVSGEDDIGQLTAAFNQMAANLRQSLGKDMHSQELLLRLSGAAQAMQQARTPKEVYVAISAEMAKIGFNSSILLLTEDKENLRVGHLSYDASLIRAAEKLTGLSADTFQSPVPAGGYFERIIKKRETLFISPMGEFIAEALPKKIHFLAQQVANMLGLRQGIIAPLIVDGELMGIITVTGDNLTETDVTAVSTFADQTAIALQNAQLIALLQQNEARFRAIFEHAGMGIARVDMAGRPQESNPALQQMLGYDAPELRHKVFTEFTHPEDAANDMALYKSLIAGKRDAYSIQKRYIHKNGDQVWAELTVSLVRTAQGEPAFAIGMVQDITERKQAEQELARYQEGLEELVAARTAQLQKSEARFRALFQAVPIPVLVTRISNGTVLETNDYVADVVGIPVDQVVGSDFSSLYRNKGERPERLEQFLDQGHARNHELQIVRPDGALRTLLLSTAVIDYEGEPALLSGFLDVTERKEMEEALRESKELWQKLFTESPIGKAIVSLDYRFEQVNPRFCEILGYTEEELMALTFSDITHPADLDADLEQAEQLIAGDIPRYVMEKRYFRKDGSVVWIQLTGTVVRDEAGEPLFAVIMIEDIHERKLMADAVKRSEARYRTLAESSPDMIFLINPDLTVDYVNQIAANQFGKEAADVVGQPHAALFPAEIGTRQQRALQHVLTSGETIETESKVSFPTADVWLHNRLVPITQDGDSVTAVLGVSRDITALKETEFTLKEKAADLERSNEELQQFAYVASHDLQEPLRMVTSYLQLLQRRYEGQLDESADEFIGFAVDGASRMKVLINDLLAYSRVGTRGNPFAPVQVAEVLQKALANLKISIEDTEAHITHDHLPTVQADAGQMVQLFQNLIGNALKFRSDARPEIHIGVTRQDDMWQFSIRDNGIGFDSQFADRIFVIFQRLHTRTQYGGTGIGLAICKKIVLRHQGQIWVESQPGVGTTFFFTIPINHEQIDD